jgi:hypothetical protein
MLRINRKSLWTKSLMLLALFATLTSFSGNWGGDSYQVYVNGKLVMDQYVHGQKGIKTIALQQANANDQVSVVYSHCGAAGKSRTISLRDGNNKVLKQWTFDDAGTNGSKPAMMSCKAIEILNVKKTSGLDRVNLFYTSKELPEGRLLAYIITAKDNVGTP